MWTLVKNMQQKGARNSFTTRVSLGWSGYYLLDYDSRLFVVDAIIEVYVLISIFFHSFVFVMHRASCTEHNSCDS